MFCPNHKNGCGQSLKIGDVLLVDGSEMELVHGSTIYIAVYKLDDVGHRTCKVGILKAIPGQIHLFCNRVGRVSRLWRRRGEIIYEKAPGLRDGISYPVPRKETRSGKTLEICQVVGDYARLTFIDGGRCTAKPIRSSYSEEDLPDGATWCDVDKILSQLDKQKGKPKGDDGDEDLVDTDSSGDDKPIGWQRKNQSSKSNGSKKGGAGAKKKEAKKKGTKGKK